MTSLSAILSCRCHNPTLKGALGVDVRIYYGVLRMLEKINDKRCKYENPIQYPII